MTQIVPHWPALPFDEWKDTCNTLHLWTQIVGKIRLACAPMVNHWWQVPLYVTSRGLTTSAMPHGRRSFQINFDFIDHRLVIQASDGSAEIIPLEPRSVAEFYREVMERLRSLQLDTRIWTMPVEIPDPIPFENDHMHRAYDAKSAQRFWHVLILADQLFSAFRARFIGKVSPVHFWWGSFDHAVTRFSGRVAPPREVADKWTQEAYSHEVISHGFWPGGNGVQAAFYSYTAPEPPGLSKSTLKPDAAFYSGDLKEFLLPYDAVRLSPSPETALMDFLESTYEAGANLAKWDRKALER
jgi:hypothetical protein